MACNQNLSLPRMLLHLMNPLNFMLLKLKKATLILLANMGQIMERIDIAKSGLKLQHVISL